MPLHLWTSARHTFPLPPDHRFPIAKCEALRLRVVAGDNSVFTFSMQGRVIILQTAREVGIPVVITIAGGYGRDPETTVAIHAETARLAAEFVAAGSASV